MKSLKQKYCYFTTSYKFIEGNYNNMQDKVTIIQNNTSEKKQTKNKESGRCRVDTSVPIKKQIESGKPSVDLKGLCKSSGLRNIVNLTSKDILI
jgi:hypothetical protein